jgi:hypothetical protein
VCIVTCGVCTVTSGVCTVTCGVCTFTCDHLSQVASPSAGCITYLGLLA